MSSIIKVDNIQNQSGDNIIKEDSNTITLGASGDTVTLASGASQTGFGRTGTVDWQTTPKTANFTAVNGEGYFINTTSGAIRMTMPSGSAGAIVSIQDYNKTFDSNSFTVTPASGEKINGGVADGNLVISTEGQGLTFVYVDATVGWKTVYENDFTSGGALEIIATGGTITTCGDCKIHTFTGPGTFCVSSISGTPANNQVSYLVVAGGGGGGTYTGGGGGAGGFREDKSPLTPYTSSPLEGAGTITVTATAFPITVGGGGTEAPPGPGAGSRGSNSIFSSVTSAGGGGGAGNNLSTPLTPGASGGGGTESVGGGTGNTPPVSPAQGTNGGNGSPSAPPSQNDYYEEGGGGGGATAAGGNGQTGPSTGNGGAGATTSITGTPTTYAGGGGGGKGSASGGTTPSGGSGGGGNGAKNGVGAAQAGTANTGGGGGGSGASPAGCGQGAAGGSGIVIIRYKFQ